jgi:hypothetical protein
VKGGRPPFIFETAAQRLIPTTADSPLPISNLNRGVRCYVRTRIVLLLPILPIVVVRFPNGECVRGERERRFDFLSWFRVPVWALTSPITLPVLRSHFGGSEFATGFRFGRAGFSSVSEEKPADPSTPHVSIHSVMFPCAHPFLWFASCPASVIITIGECIWVWSNGSSDQHLLTLCRCHFCCCCCCGGGSLLRRQRPCPYV